MVVPVLGQSDVNLAILSTVKLKTSSGLSNSNLHRHFKFLSLTNSAQFLSLLLILSSFP